jgi:hypothetical protein
MDCVGTYITANNTSGTLPPSPLPPCGARSYLPSILIGILKTKYDMTQQNNKIPLFCCFSELPLEKSFKTGPYFISSLYLAPGAKFGLETTGICSQREMLQLQ